LDAALAASLANEPDGLARSRAIAFGKAVADAVIAIRDSDGWNAAGSNSVGTAPGQWRPTPPNFVSPLDVQWATLVPFAMTGSSQFRPPGAPAPGTAAFKEARAAVAAFGGAQSTVRTADQTQIAHYWSDAVGTYSPAGHWNAIAAGIVAPLRPGMAAEAELFAKLNVAMADAGIAVADAKYTYWSWRPVTAIRADDYGEAAIPDWLPLLETPNHPSYISGHSSFSGAASAVLTALFGTRTFSSASTSLPGVTRTFTSFEQAAEEAAMSRVYGGIHFPFDNADGLATGRAVGAWTLAAFQRIAEDRGPVIMVDRPTGTEGKGPHTITGCALDNLSPVTVVTARFDGGEPSSLVVDDRGWFALPPLAIAASGRHEVVLTATSITGQTSAVRLEIDQ
jgi:membrane-associated phospholipid phosphatase